MMVTLKSPLPASAPCLLSLHLPRYPLLSFERFLFFQPFLEKSGKGREELPPTLELIQRESTKSQSIRQGDHLVNRKGPARITNHRKM